MSKLEVLDELLRLIKQYEKFCPTSRASELRAEVERAIIKNIKELIL